MNNKIKWTGALFLLLNGSWVWAASLPADLTWETNDTDPVFASPKALPGGNLNLFVDSFPLTFRTVGPDSNGSFRSFILDNQMRLISFHPNTGNPIPALANAWAIAPTARPSISSSTRAPSGPTASRSPPMTTPSATR